ncbi:uncharacterized protein C24B11.05-like [Momordica charantia]|uniref:Uncharacterized protein C24B11.05-like n=1 Tax=Momordica charantia TaxID=3673 RepID=A0A6J1DPA2_MOMCH|nr:uncharacterized protein C24B11.05-like [Momordica charantia]XP_022155114.1 uncharacterized protein C24B11.05-like [Momordica charantia]
MENGDQFKQFPDARYECLLFDLDDTLYSFNSGLAKEITKNIQEYMIQKLGVEEKVPEICISLYKIYGTTMAGLRAIGYNFDYDDFHSFVHGRLPYDMLKPDPVLRNLLLSLPIRKLIFTNADMAHATRVLKRLGLEDCFEAILCFETLNPNKGTVDDEAGSEIFDINQCMSSQNSGLDLPKTPVICKPFEEAFKKVFKIADISPQKTLFFDDSIRNLQTGKSTGLHTVLVSNSQRSKGVDHAFESIHNIREGLPELWEVEEKADSVTCSGKVAIETSVRA